MPVTDEDIVRDLLKRSTSHLQPSAAIAMAVLARQHRRDRHRRVASLTAAGAALATAASVIALVPGQASHLPGTATGKATATGAGSPTVKAPAIKLTAEERTLNKLSSAAASQLPGQGRYVKMMTSGQDVKDTSVFDSLTGDMWSYQQGTDGSPSGGGDLTKHASPTAAQFAAMPTGMSALRAALIAAWNAANTPTKADREAQAAQNAVLRKHHRPVWVPIPIVVSDDDKVFQQANSMLWYPLVGPALRSALYRVLETVPGVVVNSSARDANGERSVKISRTDSSGLPRGKSDGNTYITYEDPATGAVLESETTYPPGTGPMMPNGTQTTYDLTMYLSVTWSSTVPPNPYGG